MGGLYMARPSAALTNPLAKPRGPALAKRGEPIVNTPARAGLSNGLSTRLVPAALPRLSTSRLVLGGCHALDVAVRHCVTCLAANPVGHRAEVRSDPCYGPVQRGNLGAPKHEVT